MQDSVSRSRTNSPSQRHLVPKITCPNCWHRFPVDQLNFIAKHPDLIGDPIAGANEYLRFAPMRFNVQGEALDERGMATSEMACPHCHLEIYEQLMELSPMFISLVGAPASGKSYFLSSMTWQLRQWLPRFNFEFTDADPFANSVIHDYEHALFMNPEPQLPTEISKTQTDDPRLYRMVSHKGISVRSPRPMQFSINLTKSHQHYNPSKTQGRVMILYDNAGEDYLPQNNDYSSAVIQHIAKSQILFMLFDLTQDPRFQSYCDSGKLTKTKYHVRQESVLRNLGIQIRRYLGISTSAQIKTPLVIIIPKFDVCKSMGAIDIESEPYKVNGDNQMALDLSRVESYSNKLKTILETICPEVINTSNALSSTVVFIPVSSLGCCPELVQKGEQTFYGIKPQDIKPKWVTVPLIYSLGKWGRDMIAKI